MTSWTKCDNCGRLQQEPRRTWGEERAALWEERKDHVLISLEHNEDSQSFDACSWACVADLALKQAAAAVVDGGEA